MGQAQEIGDRLFSLFQSAAPVGCADAKRDRSPREWERLVGLGLKRLYAEAAVEREKYHLGILGRARVAFHLQNKMMAAGYPPSLVRQVLFSLLVSAFAGRSL